MKRLVFDLDNTLTQSGTGDYETVLPRLDVIEQLRQYKQQGYEIIISTARNMRTYQGSVGKINANTLPIIIEWLKRHNIPHDEIHVAKPWCGFDGFYIDDRAIRPSEFVNLTSDEIGALLDKEK